MEKKQNIVKNILTNLSEKKRNGKKKVENDDFSPALYRCVIWSWVYEGWIQDGALKIFNGGN